ncbi:ACP phosphodiesterase [Propionivibrio limicola]|uniref:acyl carrier protein phosphodiesterase n=1 Tax=Propionivibrio limicola TaxID=167645 RepID=UPI001291A58E|nr:ACP phosphodiesterase [Propionivibrio limicola]
MNFLAHALLAGDADTDQIGGLMGDFVKGPLPAGLPPALASGVALHRAIDSFAEQHDAFIASRARISPLRRRLSGVLVDMFYDHLLARDWTLYGSGPLDEYTCQLYAALQNHVGHFSPKAREVADKMRTNDWLGSYRESAMIGHAIDRMANYRLRRPNPLGGGIEEFLANEHGFEADFRAFLPDAIAFAARWRSARDAGISRS